MKQHPLPVPSLPGGPQLSFLEVHQWVLISVSPFLGGGLGIGQNIVGSINLVLPTVCGNHGRLLWDPLPIHYPSVSFPVNQTHLRWGGWRGGTQVGPWAPTLKLPSPCPAMLKHYIQILCMCLKTT